MTAQRRLILEHLQRIGAHLTADEIHHLVRRELPKISLGTVYRNLEILSEHGLIKNVCRQETERRFEGNMKPHYHIRCVSCGRIEDAPVEPFSNLEQALRDMTDYEIMGHELEFKGLCPRCRAEKAGSKR
ncbi:MAG: transcriptional repressor [Thermodesulfobacteriota bacterium]|nr:transcriptional repressor [Thermodesulfobacteriota bacterium]